MIVAHAWCNSGQPCPVRHSVKEAIDLKLFLCFISHEKDRKRQEQLAKERLEQRKKQIAARKLAKQAGQPPPEEEKPSPPRPVPLPEDANNKQALQDAVVKEMEIRYHEERDLLVQVGKNDGTNKIEQLGFIGYNKDVTWDEMYGRQEGQGSSNSYILIKVKFEAGIDI